MITIAEETEAGAAVLQVDIDGEEILSAFAEVMHEWGHARTAEGLRFPALEEARRVAAWPASLTGAGTSLRCRSAVLPDMTSPLPAKPDYQLLTDPAELETLTDRLIAEAKPIGYDIETSYEGEPRPDAQKHPEENFICGFSLTNSLAWARAVPIAFESGPNIDPEVRCGVPVPAGGRPATRRAARCWCRTTHIFELRCTARLFEQQLGIPLEEAYFEVRSDTMVEAYIEAAHESYALKSLTWETFGHKMTEIMELFGDGLTKRQQDCIQFHLLDQTSPKVIDYMCEDALWALAHHLKRYPEGH